MELPEKPKVSRLTTALIATAIICLLVGGMFGYAINSLTISNQMSDLQNRLSDLENNVSDLQPGQGTPCENDTYFLGENVSLAQLYDQVKSSVVLVRGTTTTTYYYPWGQPYYGYTEVQGSGFVSNSTGQFVIVTNYHVVDGAANITVTFADGDAYSSEVVGSDPYAEIGRAHV